MSIGHRYQNGKFVEFRFFYVGHPTKQSAVDALRRNVGPRANLRRVKAERELSVDEIAKQRLGYRQVKYIARGAAPGAFNTRDCHRKSHHYPENASAANRLSDAQEAARARDAHSSI